MAVTNYTQWRFPTIRTANGKYSIGVRINRISPGDTWPTVHYNGQADATKTLKLDRQYRDLIESVGAIEFTKHDPDGDPVVPSCELSLTDSIDVSGTADGTPVSYDLYAAQSSLVDEIFQDPNAVYEVWLTDYYTGGYKIYFAGKVDYYSINRILDLTKNQGTAQAQQITHCKFTAQSFVQDLKAKTGQDFVNFIVGNGLTTDLAGDVYAGLTLANLNPDYLTQNGFGQEGIDFVLIVVAGTGYATGDIVQVNVGNNDSRFKVTANGAGQVAALTKISGGTGSITNGVYSTTAVTGTGTGLTCNTTGWSSLTRGDLRALQYYWNNTTTDPWRGTYVVSIADLAYGIAIACGLQGASIDSTMAFDLYSQIFDGTNTWPLTQLTGTWSDIFVMLNFLFGMPITPNPTNASVPSGLYEDTYVEWPITFKRTDTLDKLLNWIALQTGTWFDYSIDAVGDFTILLRNRRTTPNSIPSDWILLNGLTEEPPQVGKSSVTLSMNGDDLKVLAGTNSQDSIQITIPFRCHKWGSPLGASNNSGLNSPDFSECWWDKKLGPQGQSLAVTTDRKANGDYINGGTTDPTDTGWVGASMLLYKYDALVTDVYPAGTLNGNPIHSNSYGAVAAILPAGVTLPTTEQLSTGATTLGYFNPLTAYAQFYYQEIVGNRIVLKQSYRGCRDAAGHIVRCDLGMSTYIHGALRNFASHSVKPDVQNDRTEITWVEVLDYATSLPNVSVLAEAGSSSTTGSSSQSGTSSSSAPTGAFVKSFPTTVTDNTITQSASPVPYLTGVDSAGIQHFQFDENGQFIDLETTLALSADQNNLALDAGTRTFRLDATTAGAPITITGFANGVPNREVRILNVGDVLITLSANSASSSATNQILGPNDRVLFPGDGFDLRYDATLQNWIIVEPHLQLSTDTVYNGSQSTLNLASGTGISLSDDGLGTVTITATGSGSGTVTSVDVSGGTTGLTTSGGPVTTSGTITFAGTLNVSHGGTGNTVNNPYGLILADSVDGHTQLSTFVALGTANQILMSNGAGAYPSFEDASTAYPVVEYLDIPFGSLPLIPATDGILSVTVETSGASVVVHIPTNTKPGVQYRIAKRSTANTLVVNGPSGYLTSWTALGEQHTFTWTGTTYYWAAV